MQGVRSIFLILSFINQTSPLITSGGPLYQILVNNRPMGSIHGEVVICKIDLQCINLT